MRNILIFLAVAVCIIPLYPQAAIVEKSNSFYSKAMGYYQVQSYDSLVYYMQKALDLRPGHPRILYNLAAGYSLSGNKEEAIKLLEKIADMKLFFPIKDDSDFASLLNTNAFNKVMKKFEYNLLPVLRSETAFRLNEKGLLTEGIAFDEMTGNFMVSSVHKRKIVEFNTEGKTIRFNSDKDTLLGIFGMRADGTHRKLWAAGGAVKLISGYNEKLKGSSLLYEFDLDTGKLLQKYEPPEKEKEHLFGDLTIDAKGSVFVSDSRSNTIYRLPVRGSNLETLLPAGNFVSLQGIAFSDNDSILFAADYSQGIFKIDIQKGEMTLLKNETTTTLLGIDGLYYYKGKLIVTQNGVNPQRILSLKINPGLSSVTDYVILEANNPEFDEPTLGVIVGDDFYFIANSQWTRFDDSGKILPDEQLDYPLILKIRLN